MKVVATLEVTVYTNIAQRIIEKRIAAKATIGLVYKECIWRNASCQIE